MGDMVDNVDTVVDKRFGCHQNKIKSRMVSDSKLTSERKLKIVAKQISFF